MRAITPLASAALLASAIFGQAQTWQSLSSQITGAPYGSGPRPANGNTWFAGTDNGDFRSTDNGLTWTNSSSGLLDGTNRIIAATHYFKTSTGRILRAGAASSWNNKVGSPVFYSDNNGTNWTEAPLPQTPVTSFLNYTEKDGALYASGGTFVPMYKSSDNGITWATLPGANFGTGVTQAVTSNSGGIYAAHSLKGIFKSTDAGVTWTPAVNGIPGQFGGIIGTIWTALDIISMPDGVLFAQVADGLWKSTDNAANWTLVSSNLGQGAIESISSDGSKLYAYTRNQVLLETLDQGASYQIVNGGTSPGLRTFSERHLNTANGVAIYMTDASFFRLDLNTAPRLPLLPTIIDRPLSRTVNVGQPLVLSVTHSSGTLPITYVWKRDGNIVPLQSSSTLTIPSASAGDAGSYTVEITNGAGTATPDIAATVSIAPNTPGTIDYTIQPISLSPFNIARTRGLAQGADGSIFVAGEFDSSTTIPGRRIIRIRPDGTIDPNFKPTNTSIGFENPFAVRPLSDGSVIVGGGNSQYLRRIDPTGALDAAFDWPTLLGGVTYALAPGPGDTTYLGGSYGLYRIFNTNGNIDFTFNPPDLDGDVRAIAIAPDGKLVIGGTFGNVNNRETRRIARILPDGVHDTTFNVGTGFTTSGFNDTVLTVAVQNDGKILAGGIFTTFRGVSAQRIARINTDGTVDAAFVPPVPNSRVNSVVVDGQGGTIIAGAFNLLGATTWNNIARLNAADGSLDTTFPAQSSNLEILSMSIQPDGKILTGTNVGFTRILGTPAATPRISFLSGDTAVAAGQPASLEVRIAGPSSGATFKWFKDGVLLPAETAAILSRPSLAQSHIGAYSVEVTIGTTVLKSEVTRLDLLGTPYFVTTPNTTPGSVGYRHHFSARAKGTGPITYQWFRNGIAVASGAGVFITTLTEADAGTYFVRATSPASTVDTTPFYFAVLPRIGTIDTSFRFNTATGTSDGQVPNTILPLSDGTFLAGGNFAGFGFPSRYLRKFFADGTWDQSYDTTALGFTTEVGQILRQSDGKIIVSAGYFSDSDKVIRLNTDFSLDPTFTVPSAIRQIIVLPDDRLLMRSGNGFFRTTANGVLDSSFPVTTFTGGSLSAMSVDSVGRILLGGNFSQVNGTPRRRVARLSAAGILDSAFVGPAATSSPPGASSIVFVTTAPDGSVFVGGRLLEGIVDGIGGNLFKLNGTTGLHDPSFYPTKAGGGTTNYITFLPDGKLGVFGSRSGSTPAPVYTVRFPNGAPDPASIGVTGTQTALGFIPVQSLLGREIVPGSFLISGKSSYNRIFTGNTPLAFVTQPATSVATNPPNTVNLGSSITLTASALGTSAVSYQWYLNDNILDGATTSSLTFNSAQKANEGSYTLVATNASGSVSSQPIYLDVLAEPEILTHPITTTLTAGGNVTLTVAAKGRPTLSYAWTRDGVTLSNISGKISGATTTSLTLTGVTEAQAGAYRAVVTNTVGSTPSNIANIIPTFLAGAADGAWPGPVPSIPGGGITANLLRTPDGGFFVTGPFTFNTRQHVVKYLADGTLDPVFLPPANATIDPTTIRHYAVDSTGRLHAAVRTSNGTSSSIFRYESNGAQTLLATLPIKAFYLMFDSQDRLMIPNDATTAPFLSRYTLSGDTITIDPTFSVTVNRPINAATIRLVFPSPSTGGYYITGTFSTVDGVNRQGAFARITSTGALDPTFGDIFATEGRLEFPARTFILEMPDGKVHVRHLRLNANGTTDTTWNSAAVSSNGSLTEAQKITGGFVDAAGKFTICYTDKVRRFLPNGNPDTSFTGPVASTLSAITQTTGGQVYVAGDFFANASTGNRADLIRLNYESTLIGFSSSPADLTVTTGQSATFTAATVGSGITYKWYQNGTLLANGGRVSGADTASLTLSGTNLTDSGSLRLEITNASGLASRTAFLTVNAPPAETFAEWSGLASVPANLRGPLDDPDGDSLPNLIEFALNLAPGSFNGNPHPTSFVSVSGQPYPSVTFTRRKDLGGTTLSVQISADLTYATDLGSTIVSITDNNDGTETVVVRSNVAQGSQRAQFFRLKAE